MGGKDLKNIYFRGFLNCVPLIPKDSIDLSCGIGGFSSPLPPEQPSCPHFSTMISHACHVLCKDILRHEIKLLM